MVHSYLMWTFLNNFQTINSMFTKPCLTIILDDFNVDLMKTIYMQGKKNKKSWKNSMEHHKNQISIRLHMGKCP
jgi:hypothetical protein